MRSDGTREVALQLLGRFRLLVDGEERALGPACQRLVALLGLNGGMERSRAAGTLWPLGSEEQALARLRTCIWRVHKALPGLILTTRTAVDLSPGVDVDVRHPPGAGSPTPYAGDLLPDWDDEWLILERERRRQIQLHELEAAAEGFARQGRFGQALAAAYAALGGDPCRESAMRIILELHAAEGNESEMDRARSRLASIADLDSVDPPDVDIRSRPGAHAAPTARPRAAPHRTSLRPHTGRR